LLVKDHILQEIGEKIVADVKGLLVPWIFLLQVLQAEHLYVLLPQKAQCGSQTEQIVVVKVHKGRSGIQFDSVHLFAAEIWCTTEGCKWFVGKVLLDYLAESEVDENESAEFVAKSDVIVFYVVVDDSEGMESEQAFLEVLFHLVDRLAAVLFNVLAELHSKLNAVLEHHNIEAVNVGHAGPRFQSGGYLQQAVLREDRAEMFESEFVVTLLEAFDRDIPPFVVALEHLPVRTRSNWRCLLN
jgi:hypothetical protein